MPIYASDEHLTRDVLNSLIESFCVENKTKYQTSITLNLEATFEDVAFFCDAFRKYNEQYTIKKNSSPDFAKVLEIWIHEIETKVNVYSPLKGDEEKYYSLLSDVYFRTTMVKQSQLGNVYKELFSQNYSDRKTNTEKMFVYKFLPEKLLEISQGFVYAHKLPELKKELIELSKEETGQKTNINETLEPMPKFEFKTAAQKIAWLHEIGILETVMNKCKDGETINSRRAANVIHSFTGIDAGTLRKCLGAIYQPGTDQKNNPLKTSANKLFVAEMATKFKLNKENKQK